MGDMSARSVVGFVSMWLVGMSNARYVQWLPRCIWIAIT